MFIINREKSRHIVLSCYAMYYITRRFIPESLYKKRVQIINLHSLLQSEERHFRALLNSLLKYHSFISYSEAVKRIQESNIDKPYLSITFDDGLKTCLRAAEILNEYGISGCFFVCPPIIDEIDNTKIEKFCRERLLIPRTDFLSWRDIGNMVKKGHELGSHTMTHPNMANLTSGDIINEIESSVALLRKQVGDVRHFAWPFGRFFHFSRQAVDAVFGTGLESCASGERGCHIPNGGGGILKKADICIRRDHVIATWPVEHVLFFLARNSRRANVTTDFWPVKYNEGINL